MSRAAPCLWTRLVLLLLAVVRTAATVHGGFTAGTDGGWLIALSAVERCSSDYG